MADINNTILFQRMTAQLDRIERQAPPGGSPPSGNGGLEARVAKLEASMQHAQDDIREIKTDLRTMIKGGATAFLITWGGILALGVMIMKGFGWLK